MVSAEGEWGTTVSADEADEADERAYVLGSAATVGGGTGDSGRTNDLLHLVPEIDEAPSPISTASGEQKLLWGDWGGVVLIAAILLTVIVVLTLTVGALPL